MQDSWRNGFDGLRLPGWPRGAGIWRRLTRLPRWLWGGRLRRIMLLAVLMGAPLVAAFGPRLVSALYAQPHKYTLADVPPRPVGIVFGAQVYPSGRLSGMLADRVEAGAALYHAGRVEVLLLTGDNSTDHYNEPEAMRRYARQLGVPDAALVLDYAGFRTYDSCYRARDIFGVASAILVTQDFHLDRALLICNTLGLDAVGVAADEVRTRDYRTRSLVFSQVREIPATAVAVLDLLRRPEPVLGEPLPIFSRVD